MNQPYREDEMETVHVYIYEEQPKKPFREKVDHVVMRLVQVVAIGMVVAQCLIPYTPPSVTTFIRVPAHFLPIQVFSAHSSLVPTGKTEHPAVQAHGILTVYNGLSVVQQLPAGVIVTTQSGQEIATDQLVTIPAANPPSFGMATASARAVVAGSSGNIPTGQINQNYGTAVTIKNLSAFQGGKDAYTEQFVTSDDRAKAQDSARAQVAEEIPSGLLAGPCAEKTAQDSATVTVTWACQYVTYSVPRGVKVLSARVEGRQVIVQVSEVVLPR